MRGRLRVLALCAALALAASQRAASQVHEISAAELTLPAAGATHDLAVSAYLFDGSRWETSRARGLG